MNGYVISCTLPAVRAAVADPPLTCSVPLVDAVLLQANNGAVIPIVNDTLTPLDKVEFRLDARQTSQQNATQVEADLHHREWHLAEVLKLLVTVRRIRCVHAFAVAFAGAFASLFVFIASHLGIVHKRRLVRLTQTTEFRSMNRFADR